MPHAGDVDALVVMGGPMSVNEYDRFPWLTGVKGLIGGMIASDKPVLGICLGSQLLASVLGSPVYRNEHKEIGWFPVELTEAGKQHPFTAHLPATFNTFHWHGDTFDLPDGALHLARSAGCKNQAFVYGKSLGLQFHMEMTQEGMVEICERCARELVDGPYIQQLPELLGGEETEFNHRALDRLLDAWIAR